MKNYFKIAILFLAPALIFSSMAELFDDNYVLTIVLGLVLAISIFVYWFADNFILKNFNARELDNSEQPELFWLTSQLVKSAKMPMLKLYVLDSNAINGFAIGRNDGSGGLVFTKALLENFSREELAAIISFGLGLIKSRETLIATIVGTFVLQINLIFTSCKKVAIWWEKKAKGLKIIRTFSGYRYPITGLLRAVITPFSAMLVQTMISPARFFKADRFAIALTGNPSWSIDVLKKLQYGQQNLLKSGPSTAHMFFAPVKMDNDIAHLFNVSPSFEKRIVYLQIKYFQDTKKIAAE